MSDGKILKRYIEKNRIVKAQFARDLNISPQRLNRFFNTETIAKDTKSDMIDHIGHNIFEGGLSRIDRMENDIIFLKGQIDILLKMLKK